MKSLLLEDPHQSPITMVTYCVRRCLMFARNVLLAGTSSGLRRLSSHSQVQSTCMTPEITGAFHLNRRGVVRIAGRDTVDLLQGLITSDVTEMNNVGHGVRAQYSMMLNVQVGALLVLLSVQVGAYGIIIIAIT